MKRHKAKWNRYERLCDDSSRGCCRLWIAVCRLHVAGIRLVAYNATSAVTTTTTTTAEAEAHVGHKKLIRNSIMKTLTKKAATATSTVRNSITARNQSQSQESVAVADTDETSWESWKTAIVFHFGEWKGLLPLISFLPFNWSFLLHIICMNVGVVRKCGYILYYVCYSMSWWCCGKMFSFPRDIMAYA